MDTKQRILDEALTLFSQKGYANVYVNDIAEKVGIKAPSLYKHYKNKKAIFDAIIEEMNNRFAIQAKNLNIIGNDPAADARIYESLSEEEMIKLGFNLFEYYIHDDYVKRFRKMLTIEQFHNKELADTYTKLYVDDPLLYQGLLLGQVVSSGGLSTENVDIMTLHFFAPIYMLLTMCDRNPEREPEAFKILESHIRQFNKLYSRKRKEV